MESEPQNPEFRKNPENIHPCNLNACSVQIMNRQGEVEKVEFRLILAHLVLTLSCI